MMTRDCLEAASRVLRALAHPVRLGVLQSLADGELTVSELQARLGCSQPTMSLQLQTLESQRLVRSRRVGTAKYVAINNPDLLNLFVCMEHHLSEYLRVPASAPAPAGTRGATRRTSQGA